MISQIIKEIEPLVSTDLEGNRYVKEEDVTAIACKYALSPDALGRVHEALDIRQIEIKTQEQFEELVKYGKALSMLEVACQIVSECYDELNEVQKDRIVEKIEKLIPSAFRLREQLKGCAVSSETPTWDMFFESLKGGKSIGDDDYNVTGPITTEMRDYVWSYLKPRRTNVHAGDCADSISHDTGMNRGSALIYVSMIVNWLKGQENTRTMKFADFVYYLNCIKEGCSTTEYENTIASLKRSIPYWDSKLSGNFGRKVAMLLDRLDDGGYVVQPTSRSIGGKDMTKYRFNGRIHNKKGLVLAVVQAYVARNSSVTISQLSYTFPDNLQGSRGVVREENMAKRECRDYYDRYFTKPHEVIKLIDGNMFVCTQWGIGNLPSFIEKAKKLGFQIIAIKQ